MADDDNGMVSVITTKEWYSSTYHEDYGREYKRSPVSEDPQLEQVWCELQGQTKELCCEMQEMWLDLLHLIAMAVQHEMCAHLPEDGGD
ncbi:UNVERIFIED_CONTAM: hypothetical protein K2H54_062027 [Gekko kuhli]